MKARFAWVSLLLLAVTVVQSPAQATCAVPYTLTNGQTADASQVMADFNAVLSCLNNTAPLRGYIGGLTLANDTGNPNIVLDISAGTATDSTDVVTISLNAFTKSTGGAWVAGSGNNGMGNGLSVSANTWYHVCLANNGGTPDIWFDTSAVCANRPSAISDTLYRRIGSVETNGAGHILAFSQNGDEFLWAAPVTDINTTTLGTTGTLYSLSVPSGSGLKVGAILRGYMTNNVGSGVLINSPDENATSSGSPAGNTSAFQQSASQYGTIGQPIIRTNTSGQVRAVAGVANTTFTAATVGWIDSRGRFN